VGRNALKTVCLDIDGVLMNFTASYAAALAKVHGSDLLPNGWQVDPEFPPKWSWESHYGYTPAEEREVWQEHILKSNNFWLKLKPLPHARETLSVLNGLSKAGEIDLFFISHRMGLKAKYQTTMSLYENGIDFPCILFAEDKVPLLRALKANFFIDDKPETLMNVEAASHNEKWPDFNLYIQDAGYNRSVKVGQRVANVKEALIAAGVWV
jgi:hypothetical protein